MKICVVGAGISGLATAHYLSECDGVDVTVLERSPELGGRANVTENGEHCTRVFLDDYHFLNDVLRDVPSADGGSLLDALRPAVRFARTSGGDWIELDHIYAFLSRSAGLTVRDKVSILRSNRKALLAAVDADRRLRADETPGRGRWTIRMPEEGGDAALVSSNRYGSVWNWSPAGLMRALRSAGSSADASVLRGSTERHLIRPWADHLRRRGVTIVPDRAVTRFEVAPDSVRVQTAATRDRFDAVVVAAFVQDAYELVDRSGYPRTLDHRTHTHFKAFTIDLDPRETVLVDPRSRIFSSAGITTVLQPAAQRCVCMATYPSSTEREFVLDVVRDQLALDHEPTRVLERDNLEPGEAVFVGDYVDPVVLASALGDRVQFAGSCMDNSYPVDSAEGACRSAYNAVDRLARQFPEVRVRPRPDGAGAPIRRRLFGFTARERAHPNRPSSPALAARLWRIMVVLSTALVGVTAGVELRGVRPDTTRPSVYVATHRSLFDAPLGVSVFGRWGARPRLVVAARYFNHPLGCFLRGIGALVAIRGSGATVNAAVAAVASGESVAFMIEGRVVERAEAGQARHGRGPVETALHSGAPIVPIAAAGAERVWPARSARPVLRPWRRPVVVVAGEPIEPVGTPDELAARVRRVLTDLEDDANGDRSSVVPELQVVEPGPAAEARSVGVPPGRR